MPAVAGAAGQNVAVGDGCVSEAFDCRAGRAWPSTARLGALQGQAGDVRLTGLSAAAGPPRRAGHRPAPFERDPMTSVDPPPLAADAEPAERSPSYRDDEINAIEPID